MKFIFYLNIFSNILYFFNTLVIPDNNEKVILISFDGFLHNYLELVESRHGPGFTPNFDKLIREGVFVEGGLKGSYATVTIPSHWTIATGMYQESHGVVGREMYDPRINETLKINGHNKLSPFWFNNGSYHGGGGEPIWVTNEKQGGTSGVIHWIGLDIKLHGFLPTKSIKYERDIAFGHKETFEKLIEWLINDESVNLLLLYISQPDHIGHIYGPESNEVVQEIIRLDGLIGYFIERLEEEYLFDSINLIITSDHGMAKSNKEKVIILEDYLESSKYISIDESPIIQITPKAGTKVEEIIRNLSSVEHVKVWRKDDIPSEFHYKFNERIMPILLTADLNWNIVKTKREYGKWFHLGSHGYNNNISSMHPIFIGRGPIFKTNYTAQPFESVDIYPLICELLNLKPFSNNGSFQRVVQIIREDRLNSYGTFSSPKVLIGLFLSIFSLFSILLGYIFYNFYVAKQYFYFRFK